MPNKMRYQRYLRVLSLFAVGYVVGIIRRRDQWTNDLARVNTAMGLVVLALLPATLFGLYQFGWPAIFLFLVTNIAVLLVLSVMSWAVFIEKARTLVHASRTART